MRRALVVDDSKAIQMIMRRTLGILGYEVAIANNGLEAIETVRKNNPFNIALVDWNMPVMNGLEFVKALRADPRHNRLKVLMVTSETEIDRMSVAMEAGANDYIMKPFTAEIIACRLEALGE